MTCHRIGLMRRVMMGRWELSRWYGRMCTGRGMRWGTRGDVYLGRHAEISTKIVIGVLHLKLLGRSGESRTTAWIRHDIRHVLLYFHVALDG